jgi:2-polyprenyl-3-methyl-5-hydroxy-6-metoxy-1,4-benzoquinol methylase
MDENNYYNGINYKLMESIPSKAIRILELGCANGKLGELYKKNNKESHWTGVDYSSDAVNFASKKLDRVLTIDLNNSSLINYFSPEEFDVIVIGDLIEHLNNPEKLLEDLHILATSNANIFCCLPNMTHYSVLQKFISGDILYEDMGLMDRTHVKFYSPGSAFKMFLDTGWLPNLNDQYRIEPPDDNFLRGILHSAKSMGIPSKTTLNNIGMYQMIIACSKVEKSQNFKSEVKNKLSVVIPVNRTWEFSNNILSSPGLKEINAEIIPVKNARSAAEAFEAGKNIATNPWILFLHQDVYVPKGSGNLLEFIINNKIETSAPIGFAGLELSNTSIIKEAGLVIDRTKLFQHASTGTAISADEFAILMHKDCIAKIDEDLAWHLWATDLFLQSYIDTSINKGFIARVPLFHNSVNDYSLPEDFHVSSKKLLQKYPYLNKIETLCGSILR